MQQRDYLRDMVFRAERVVQPDPVDVNLPPIHMPLLSFNPEIIRSRTLRIRAYLKTSSGVERLQRGIKRLTERSQLNNFLTVNFIARPFPP